MLPQTLLDALIPLVRQVGEAVMQIYDTDFSVISKADASPLTEADLAAHGLIVAALQNLTPDIPVLSEESADIPWSQRQHWQRFWLVDPIDGTREFVQRTGEFTVNIALIEQGRPVLGLVSVPARQQIYGGIPGQGAWCWQAGEDVKVLQVLPEQSPLRVLASRSHLDAQTQAWIEALGPHQLVQAGSSLKFCRIAEGQADLYPRFGPTCEWDTASAQAVLEGAGGSVLQPDGRPLRYGKEQYLNPHFIARSGR